MHKPQNKQKDPCRFVGISHWEAKNSFNATPDEN